MASVDLDSRSYDYAVNSSRSEKQPNVYVLDDLSRTNSSLPKYLKLNVGGTSYRFQTRTVLKRSNASLLYRFLFLSHEQRLEVADGYLETVDEYFFERPSPLFEVIYLYYVTGECHRPRSACLDVLLGELTFWNLNQILLAECCFPKMREPDGFPLISEPTKHSDEFHNLPCARVRRKVWNLIEVPESSMAARVFSALSILAVLVSNMGLILASLPDLQVTRNETIQLDDDLSSVIQVQEPHPIFEYIEYCCIVWFSVEYLGKMLVAARRRKVFFEVLNIIDLIAILPFYIELTLNLVGYSTAQLQELKGALLVIRILRVLRVIRIFKLGRYSSGLRAFAKTLHASKEQLSMLGVVLCTGVMFFSTLVYFLEKDEVGTDFTSIPAAFWWCIVTMTTVGYGDVVPQTIAGKLVASGAIACGVLVLALPITIIVDNFMKVQEDGGPPTSTPRTHPFMRPAKEESQPNSCPMESCRQNA